MAMAKRNTVNKENIKNKNVLLTYKKGLLRYKQDLLTYTRKSFAYKWKKAKENSHGEFSQQIVKYVIQKMVWSNPLFGRASRVTVN